MKNKFAQLVLLANKLDRHYLQLAYMAVMVFGLVVLHAPTDGGTGPY